MQESTVVQLAFSNGWHFGVSIFPGDITINDLCAIIPLNPLISTVGLAGKEMIVTLEDNLERTFKCDP